MNFKTPFKVLTTAALIGTLSLSAVAPGVASAADKTVTAQAETPANFALEKVILVKGDSKISVSFDTYIDVLGNEKALNGYELAYVVAANGEVFALDTYVDFYEAGNTEEEVVEKLSKAGKTSEVTEVKDGAFNDGKLEPVEDTAATAKADLEKAVAAAKATEIKDAAAKAELTKAIEAAEKAAAKEDATKEELEAAKAELAKAVEAAKKADAEAALEAKVESVTAINAKTIEVKFNKELDETTVNDSNVTSTTASIDTVTLAEDKKTIVIALSTAMTNNSAQNITLTDDIKTVDGKTLSKDTVKTFVFNDEEKPEVTKTEVLSNGSLKLTFNEALAATAGSVVINGFEYSVTPTAGDTTVTISKADLIDPSNAGLEKGKKYSVYVESFTDLANPANEMDLYTGEVTYNYSADTVAPTVSKIEATDEKTLKVTFSEEIAGVTKNDLTDAATEIGLTVKKGSNAITTTATTKDGKTFTLNLSAAANAIYDGTAKEKTAELTVTLEGYKDLDNNIGTKKEQKVTVTKDELAPTFTKAEYDFTNEEIILTASEGLAADTSTTYNDILTIIDENGVKQTISSTVLAITAGDKKVKLSNAAGALNLAPGTYKLTVAKDAVKDQAVNTPNGNTAYTTTIVIPETDTDTEAPTVNTVTAAADTLTVTFSEAVKGGDVEGSATNPANYKLAGKALPEGTLITLNGNKNEATIELPAGSIAKTEKALFEVSNVQDLAGNKIAAKTQKTVSVTDTVAPVLESAKYDADAEQLVLTFSEDVTGAAAADFTVKVNGVAVTPTVESNLPTDKGNIVRLSANANLATGEITVTTSDSATGADAEGNVIKADTKVTATR